MTDVARAQDLPVTLDPSEKQQLPEKEGLPGSLRHNSDVAWDAFESHAYWNHNYRYLRVDDRHIIHEVGAFFSRHFAGVERVPRRGLDVGSGANLYPALAMLPWCDEVLLTDHSPANRRWLEQQLQSAQPGVGGSWTWQPFWDEFTQFPGYQIEGDIHDALAKRTVVRECSVFELEPAQWDLGTMFFVAESMTNFETEFEGATHSFLSALRPASPFAAAFMDSSKGYVVGDKSFPAVREVTVPVVEKVLATFGATAVVTKVDVPANDPLRDDYDGMIIAVGTVSA